MLIFQSYIFSALSILSLELCLFCFRLPGGSSSAPLVKEKSQAETAEISDFR